MPPEMLVRHQTPLPLRFPKRERETNSGITARGPQTFAVMLQLADGQEFVQLTIQTLAG